MYDYETMMEMQDFPVTDLDNVVSMRYIRYMVVQVRTNRKVWVSSWAKVFTISAYELADRADEVKKAYEDGELAGLLNLVHEAIE